MSNLDINKLDARGLSCPEPVIMIKKAVDEAKTANKTAPGNIPEGMVFTIMVDNKTSVENITRFGEHAGLTVTNEKTGDDYTVTLKK
ncbi:MAG: sulfurtransferase TusA family protein [Lachnospiraceae bacterium]|nr:sulfurtransferase TusA family protein [Lachnospiraceae bacterium]MCR5767604.1 sulfurtransferase TusA family protein [Lachnospiraceae bacterium]